MKAQRYYWTCLILFITFFMGCTDPDYEIAESVYFTKTLPADYGMGGIPNVIFPKADGGYLLGSSWYLLETNALGNDMAALNYSKILLKTRNGWYGMAVNQQRAIFFIDKLNQDLQPVDAFSLNPELEPFLHPRHIDISPDGEYLVATVRSGDHTWILLAQEGVLLWKYQLPQEMMGIELLNNFAAIYNDLGNVQVLAQGQEEDGMQGLYLFELSLQSGVPGDIYPLGTDLSGFHRVRRIGDRFLVEGYFEETGNFAPYNDWYPAIALLDQGFNQYRYWHLTPFQYKNIVVSNNSDHLYLLNSEGNSYYQTVEQLDFNGTTLEKWRIKDEGFIHQVEMDPNGDFLILGQMDGTDEYGENNATYFIRSKAEDPFAAFY